MKAYKEMKFNRIAKMQFKKIIQTFYAELLEHLQKVRDEEFIFILFHFILFFIFMCQT